MDIPQRFYDAVERAAQRRDTVGYRSALSELGAATWAARPQKETRESIQEIQEEIQEEIHAKYSKFSWATKIET